MRERPGRAWVDESKERKTCSEELAKPKILGEDKQKESQFLEP